MLIAKKTVIAWIFPILVSLFTLNCSEEMGWGILLWSNENPPIPAGTVVPVYIQSNIDKVWVIGVPENFLVDNTTDGKIEIPLAYLELVGSKSRAERRAEEFSEFALTYAENMQNGLPIRDNPDNNARRVYRLRLGEIVKILWREEGSPAISATGEALPGEWYKVLTEDGTIGFCFSYRLKLFTHTEGELAASGPEKQEIAADLDLEDLFSKTWSAEVYLNMANDRKINLEAITRRWRFEPGNETGIARIIMPEIDRSFRYTAIVPEGRRGWRFEEADLTMQLRSDTTLAVQYIDSGAMKTLLFVSLPTPIDELIAQERVRRERLFNAIFYEGPVFTSLNYGTITFKAGGTFSWEGFELLVPQPIPEYIEGNGAVSMNLFLSQALQERYNGAFTMRFSNEDGANSLLYCMYSIDSQGFRLEIVPESSIDDITVMRRDSAPVVLYFFKDNSG